MRLASREFRLLVLAVSGFRAPVESRRPGRTTGVLPTAQRCEYQDSLDRLSLYWPPKNVMFTTCRTPGRERIASRYEPGRRVRRETACPTIMRSAESSLPTST